MPHTESEELASIIARAIADIAVIGPQQHRDMCLQVSGTRTMSEFAVRLEQSLNRFLQHNGVKAKRSKHTEDHRSPYYAASSISSHAQKNSNYREEHENATLVKAGDFSSEEDAPTGMPVTAAGQDELFDTPPRSRTIDRSEFSPEPDSLPSTFDPASDSCSTFLSSDFSDDEFSDEERTMPPPLVRRFSNSLKMSGHQGEGPSTIMPSSSAPNLVVFKLTDTEWSSLHIPKKSTNSLTSLEGLLDYTYCQGRFPGSVCPHSPKGTIFTKCDDHFCRAVPAPRSVERRAK